MHILKALCSCNFFQASLLWTKLVLVYHIYLFSRETCFCSFLYILVQFFFGWMGESFLRWNETENKRCGECSRKKFSQDFILWSNIKENIRKREKAQPSQQIYYILHLCVCVYGQHQTQIHSKKFWQFSANNATSFIMKIYTYWKINSSFHPENLYFKNIRSLYTKYALSMVYFFGFHMKWVKKMVDLHIGIALS